MKKTLGYDDAFARLVKLTQQIEEEGIPLDALAEKVREANELIAFLENRLRVIEGDVEVAGRRTPPQDKKLEQNL